MAEDLKVPKISVIMPVYNGEKYLKEGIDSILCQTYSDFELLLINDASIDQTEKIILGYKDSRIIYIKNDQNLGLIKTLNKGLDLSKADLIARMDHDDIADPTRFEKQVKILQNNPKIGICGAWLTFFRDNGQTGTLQYPEKNENIKIGFLGHNTLGHPVIMMRKKVVDAIRYDEDYQAAEDYEFWVRLSKVTELYNIQESLLQYRIHQTNISVLENDLQSQKVKKIIGNQLLHIDINDSEQNIEYCKILFGNSSPKTRCSKDYMEMITFANEIESKNRIKKFYDEKELRTTISQKLIYIFRYTNKDNLAVIPFLLKNRKEILSSLGLGGNIKLIIKMILKTNKY